MKQHVILINANEAREGIGANLDSPRPRWGMSAKILQDRARDSRGGESRAKSALGKGMVTLSYIREQDPAWCHRQAEVFGWWGVSHKGWWWFRVKRHDHASEPVLSSIGIPHLCGQFPVNLEPNN